MVRLQKTQERNLCLQIIQSLAIHGLLASLGRIRQSAWRSQAKIVGVCKKKGRMNPSFIQQQTVNSRRCAQRRNVQGSGERDTSRQ